MKETVFYTFPKNYWWLGFNILGLLAIISCIIKCPAWLLWWQVQTLFIVFSLSLIIWCYKYASKRTMAVYDDDTIKIDHTNPIKWKDIAFAEERMVRCCGKLRKVIVLIPHDNIDYKYNFLQRHNGEFTPFSIPLYGILSKEDEEKMVNLIARKVGLKTIK